jgi:hypothetical protein
VERIAPLGESAAIGIVGASAVMSRNCSAIGRPRPSIMST